MKMKFDCRFFAGVLLAGFTFANVASAQSSTNTPVPGQFKAKYYGKLSELPVGAVQPRGWIQQWLVRQAQGLTGHPENLDYPYDTCMFAGEIPPPAIKDRYWKAWWPYEQSAYFTDATTRLSRLINDPGISQRRDAAMNYILEHSSGTNLGGSQACWPNAVVGRALMAEFSATGDPHIASVMQNWLLTSAGQITQGGRNGVNFEEGFYLYGLTGDQRLLDLCRKIYDGYLTDTNSFCSAAKIEGNGLFHEHGVTAAEELKCLPLMYSYTGDPAALQLAERAYQKVLDNNLMADGGVVSSEHLDKPAFFSVHESCDITDWSWSLGYLFMATGDAHLADLIERTTFNALPGAVTKDFKQLQYFSAANQTVIAATNTHLGHWLTRMTYRAAHDTECCAGNINRAMPNYVIRMWMRADDNGLAAVYYGPSEVTTTAGGQSITIAEETDYPFRNDISFKIKTAKPVTFDLQLRIPAWCDRADIHVNGKALGLKTEAGTFATIKREFREGDVVSLNLSMPVKVEDWFKNQGVSITRGPLVYSLKIAEQRAEHTNDPANIKPLLSGHEIRAFPEVEFAAGSDWRYGMDAGLAKNLRQIKVIESPLTENPFLEDQAPIRLELPLDHLPGWAAGLSEPSGLPSGQQQTVDGKPATMTLVPYGSTHLRLTTLPLVRPVAEK
ncbi:MAG TPA: beta-L-arabinofuranosidase domain-containing protein [Verrucomicrobiae bacterium]|nr:beta-L-arabinofuranosidase domain-containing protein [Verrucomicrobiae bacterium]